MIPTAIPTAPLSPSMRWLSLLGGVSVFALLAIARWLEPASDGFGTHQQLGLPPCTSVVFLNMRCPACGMTTSWALSIRGHWFESMQANAGGWLLSIIALVYLPASCYFSYFGRSSRGGWVSLSFAIGLIAALAAAILQWCLRLLGT